MVLEEIRRRREAFFTGDQLVEAALLAGSKTMLQEVRVSAKFAAYIATLLPPSALAFKEVGPLDRAVGMAAGRQRGDILHQYGSGGGPSSGSRLSMVASTGTAPASCFIETSRRGIARLPLLIGRRAALRCAVPRAILQRLRQRVVQRLQDERSELLDNSHDSAFGTRSCVDPSLRIAR